MKTITSKTLILLTLLLSFSCNNDKEDFQTETGIEAEIKFSEIGKTGLSGAGAEGITKSNRVISNQTEWQNLMAQMNSINNVTDHFTETDINFDNFTVIAIFSEVKGSPWAVEINEVVESETRIRVSSTETILSVATVVIVSQPFHIIKIPRTDKAILFE